MSSLEPGSPRWTSLACLVDLKHSILSHHLQQPTLCPKQDTLLRNSWRETSGALPDWCVWNAAGLQPTTDISLVTLRYKLLAVSNSKAEFILSSCAALGPFQEL